MCICIHTNTNTQTHTFCTNKRSGRVWEWLWVWGVACVYVCSCGSVGECVDTEICVAVCVAVCRSVMPCVAVSVCVLIQRSVSIDISLCVHVLVSLSVSICLHLCVFVCLWFFNVPLEVKRHISHDSSEIRHVISRRDTTQSCVRLRVTWHISYVWRDPFPLIVGRYKSQIIGAFISFVRKPEPGMIVKGLVDQRDRAWGLFPPPPVFFIHTTHSWISMTERVMFFLFFPPLYFWHTLCMHASAWPSMVSMSPLFSYLHCGVGVCVSVWHVLQHFFGNSLTVVFSPACFEAYQNGNRKRVMCLFYINIYIYTYVLPKHCTLKHVKTENGNV